jgi:PAS domain S-box-containing protein
MIKTRILDTKKLIEDASALLYQTNVVKAGWQFAPDNPSQIRVENKRKRKILVDRFTDDAIWIGAFYGKKMVGCTRLCKTDENNKFEIEGYSTTQAIKKYLPKDKSTCLESTRTVVAEDFTGLVVVKFLFLHVFKYCQANKYSVFGCVSHERIKRLFTKINVPLKIESGFKYEDTDLTPVNFYFVDYNKGELKTVINNLENSKLNTIDILKLLEIVAPIIPTPLYWMDRDGVVIGINGQCLNAMGTTRENIIGKTPYMFHSHDVADNILHHNNLVMQTGEILSQKEVSTNFATRKKLYALSIKAPLYNDNGDVIGVVGTSVDITAQEEAEELRIQNAEHKGQVYVEFKKCMELIENAFQQTKFKILNARSGNSMTTLKTDENISLSKREKEILYLLSLNKSPKEIAQIFSNIENKNIASSTINSIICKQLYPKLGVFNISQLIEKANYLKLIPFLPETFIHS